MEKGRTITREEQSCISNCILRWWGNPNDPADPEVRDARYEVCLTNCQICG